MNNMDVDSINIQSGHVNNFSLVSRSVNANSEEIKNNSSREQK